MSLSGRIKTVCHQYIKSLRKSDDNSFDTFSTKLCMAHAEKPRSFVWLKQRNNEALYGSNRETTKLCMAQAEKQ